MWTGGPTSTPSGSCCTRPSRDARRSPHPAPPRYWTCSSITRRRSCARCAPMRRRPSPWRSIERSPRRAKSVGRPPPRCARPSWRSPSPADAEGEGRRDGRVRPVSVVTEMRKLVPLLSLLAACQPQARRALILDLAVSDPLALDATAQPWQEAGYTVEYRRFYPHLTRADLARYHTLLLLGGRAPERPSDALTAGDLALLGEWVEGGRVVVLGYAAGDEGTLDRWLMNRWLAWQGAGIVIGDFALRDTLWPQAGAFDPQPPVEPEVNLPLQDPGFDPFPSGRNDVLVVSRESQALARTTRVAFVAPTGQKPAPRHRVPVVAASRLGEGLVIVMSRHALSGLGTDTRASTVPALGDLSATRAVLLSVA